jgi:hypothetical protein
MGHAGGYFGMVEIMGKGFVSIDYFMIATS